MRTQRSMMREYWYALAKSKSLHGCDICGVNCGHNTKKWVMIICPPCYKKKTADLKRKIKEAEKRCAPPQK